MFSQQIRYGIWALVSLLGTGLVWLGITQYAADRRALAAVTPPPAAAAASAVPAPAAPAPAPAEKPSVQLVVHVAGAVARPDIYRLEQGARVADAIAAAGGSLPDGMPDVLNLAAAVADGEKIFVPTRAEAQLQAQGSGVPPAAQGAAKQPVQAQKPQAVARGPGGKLPLNQATQQDLQAIGVFPATAKALVERVKQQGPFRTWDEVDSMNGVGEATLEKLKSHTYL